jgi:hypothetical protein
LDKEIQNRKIRRLNEQRSLFWKAFCNGKEAAKLSGISEHQIRLWLKAKQIGHISCGNKFMINMGSLFEYLEETSRSNACGC